MGLPGHRRTSSHKRRRAAHFALRGATLGMCARCKSPVLPHTVCGNCGYYKGKDVLRLNREAAKKEKQSERKK